MIRKRLKIPDVLPQATEGVEMGPRREGRTASWAQIQHQGGEQREPCPQMRGVNHSTGGQGGQSIG